MKWPWDKNNKPNNVSVSDKETVESIDSIPEETLKYAKSVLYWGKLPSEKDSIDNEIKSLEDDIVIINNRISLLKQQKVERDAELKLLEDWINKIK